ncbi:hypothetical protein B0T18DRAFT_482140 [Schizothecium vesticola]|uniref:Uncharacterized protein n=1 Tax=Schizothecium vesticola TaxID=314040 RepID=A0AA40EH61_9PEZI|nr:hypothetical protein B0T18DRAFT_482140 [Schizothecium vesticola]
MAARYQPLTGFAGDDAQDMDHGEGASPSPFSPTSTTSMSRSSLSSPTHSHYLSLAEQTFTPLSMDGSDFFLSDGAEDEHNVGGGWRAAATENPTTPAPAAKAVQVAGMPSMTGITLPGRATASAEKRGRPQPDPPTIAPSGRGATVVNALVQSFEALQATRAGNHAGVGYDHVSTQNRKVDDFALTLTHARARARTHSHHARRHLDSGLVSPPSTLSPGQSRSPSPRRPASAAAQPSTLNTIVRPTPTSSPPRTPQLSLVPGALHTPIVRTSSAASLALSHPAPDQNKRSKSGAFLGNIAALEASAERLSMTSSIEDAIRQEHNELKRSDSQRSSILRANSTRSARSARSTRKPSDSDAGSVFGSHLSVASRQNSIVGLNTAARLGGYSPGGFMMAQSPPVAGVAAGRLRAGSKASSIGAPPALSPLPDTAARSPEIDDGEGFPFLARQGPGKSSTRSTASKLSLIQSAELEAPTALTKEAFDQADRAGPGLDDADDDDTIRASAYQHIEAQFADDSVDYTDASQPMLVQGDRDQTFPPQQYDPGAHPPQPQHRGGEDERPTTSGSDAAYDQAQAAFGDFDGVHCDPDMLGFALPPAPAAVQPRRSGHLDPPAPRPKSYFDPSTGQQMMFYPAPVPAMLNLPPKLSKKPKAAARNMHRSQMVVSAMPQESRESRVWLPDPIQGSMGIHEPFLTDLTDLLADDPRPAPPSHTEIPHMPGGNGAEFQPGHLGHVRQPSETSTIHPYAGQQPTAEVPQPHGRAMRRPQRLTDTADKRQTRATMLDGLPPQLRASAFFDLPSSTPQVELKDGSAQATLDSILDASASAPVSAFTDHVFAGKLGAEVYGPEKKKKRAKKLPLTEGQAGRNRDTVVMTNSTSDLQPPSPKRRSSHFSLLPGRRRTSEDATDSRSVAEGNEDRRRELAELGGIYPLSDQGPVSPNELAPDGDEFSSEDEEDDEEEVYEGPPTTLLAELQLRKQQNKLRTRPAINAHPNGMHSTLLELDAVREIERKARHGKRVNLAWENPDANPDHNQDLEDDDVPLGMLAVAKAAGAKNSNIDISLVVSEMNRPLGLMERREIDDNEPLSRRRDRLQGRQTVYLPQTLDAVQHHVSQMNLSPYGPGGGLRSQSRLGLALPSPQQGDFSPAAPEEDDDDEGETLAQRKARLAAEDPLPRARPVSGMFSAELLSQFGGDPEEAQARGKGKDVAHGPDDSEVEETLGQRRRRLQAEREAQERLMAGPTAAGLGYPDANRVSRRLSMADMLGAYPREGAMGTVDPRDGDRLRRDAEYTRAQGQRDLQMAALRAQMPQSLTAPAFGAPNGGYMNGRFNDGTGGVVPARMSAYAPAGLGGQYPNMNISPAVFYGGGVPTGAMVNAGPGAVGVVPGPQQVDMVERWRQGVMH